MKQRPSSQNKYSIPAIRKLLTKAFNDQDFTIFCYDNFLDVYQEFADGLTFGRKVQLLIDYCERNNLFDDLLSLVKNYNPAKYAELSSTLQKTGQRQEIYDIQNVPAKDLDIIKPTAQTATTLTQKLLRLLREAMPEIIGGLVVAAVLAAIGKVYAGVSIQWTTVDV
jgi:hypothetical protein